MYLAAVRGAGKQEPLLGITDEQLFYRVDSFTAVVRFLNVMVVRPFDGDFGHIQENFGHAVERRIEAGPAVEHAPQGRGLLLQGRFQARLEQLQVAAGPRVGNAEAKAQVLKRRVGFTCVQNKKNAPLLSVSIGSFRPLTTAGDLGT